MKLCNCSYGDYMYQAAFCFFEKVTIFLFFFFFKLTSVSDGENLSMDNYLIFEVLSLLELRNVTLVPPGLGKGKRLIIKLLY